MHEAMFPLGPEIGHADQVKHGQMFAIGAGDAAQGDQFAHAEGRGQSRKTLDPGVAVGREGGVQLVGAADPAEFRVIADGVADAERIVAGDAEDILDAQLL